jgi:NTE family protein
MTQYGVVLGGGGAKGCYEIGVWQALRELNIPICAVVGTSVGALNGAMMVQGDYEAAYTLWTKLDIQSIIHLEEPLLLNSKKFNLKDAIGAVKRILDNRGLDVTPLRQMLTKYIHEESIRSSPADFGLVTFSLTDFKPVTVFKDQIPQGLLIDYLLASSCLPGFQPLEIERKRFVDGGLYDNIPVSLLLKKGIKDIIMVDVSGIGRVRRVNLSNLNVVSIKNSDPLCKTLQFEENIIKQGIAMGYLDTQKAFDVFEGKRYYIKKQQHAVSLAYPLLTEELTVLDALLDLKRNAAATNKLINYPLLRTLYKYIRDRLTSASLIQASAEIAAEVFGVERLKAYTWDELVEEVLLAYEDVKSHTTDEQNTVLVKKLLGSNRAEDMDTLDIKGLASLHIELSNQDLNARLYRKLTALFVPKVCIANIFVSLMLCRKKESCDASSN